MYAHTFSLGAPDHAENGNTIPLLQSQGHVTILISSTQQLKHVQVVIWLWI